MKKLPIDRYLSLQNIKKVVSESDGYQPHLIAPEQGYRRLIDGAIHYFRGPAQATVDAVHFILKELVRKTLVEADELRRFPSLRAEIASVANNALERFCEESKKTSLRMVDMESAYLTVDFLRKLPHEAENDGNPYASVTTDRYSETNFKRIGSNVMAYVIIVSEMLRNTIPKVVVHCQVQEANQSLLDHFYVQLGNKQVYQLAELFDWSYCWRTA